MMRAKKHRVARVAGKMQIKSRIQWITGFNPNHFNAAAGAAPVGLPQGWQWQPGVTTGVAYTSRPASS